MIGYYVVIAIVAGLFLGAASVFARQFVGWVKRLVETDISDTVVHPERSDND